MSKVKLITLDYNENIVPPTVSTTATTTTDSDAKSYGLPIESLSFSGGGGVDDILTIIQDYLTAFQQYIYKWYNDNLLLMHHDILIDRVFKSILIIVLIILLYFIVKGFYRLSKVKVI